VRNRRAANRRSDRARDTAGFSLSPVAIMRNIGWGPRDALAFAAGVGASVAIVVNALFLQAGPHPAPLFKPSPAGPGEATNSVPVGLPRARPADAPSVPVPMPVPAPAPQAKLDPPAPPPRPPADVPSRRVAALQRALSQFGYGQIKATGILDADTRAAIEKFERERKLPVTGQPSDRVVKELSGLTGRQLD
jgi:hypothetical protein